MIVGKIDGEWEMASEHHQLPQWWGTRKASDGVSRFSIGIIEWNPSSIYPQTRFFLLYFSSISSTMIEPRPLTGSRHQEPCSC
jgi:hypothetical protein